MTKEDVFLKIKKVLAEDFEIEPEKIVLSASIANDLELDSIDAIDLIGKLEGFTSGRLDPVMFKSVRTLEDVVEQIYKIANK